MPLNRALSLLLAFAAGAALAGMALRWSEPSTPPATANPALAQPATEIPRATPRLLPGPYPANILRVIDGDTFVARVVIWLDQQIEVRVRLRGIDAPELKAACPREAELAQAARQMLAEALAAGVAELREVSLDRYGGRVVARAFNTDGDIGNRLVDAGLARAYAGKKRKSWCE